MMKILKVIVDEMPKGCGDCSFCYWYMINPDDEIRSDMWCELVDKAVLSKDFTARPDWCPLVEESEEQ